MIFNQDNSALSGAITSVEKGLAIIVTGDTCSTAVPSGGYAYIKNNTHGLADGLYRNKTASAFPTSGGTANSTVFEAVSDGIANQLRILKKEYTYTLSADIVDKGVVYVAIGPVGGESGYVLLNALVGKSDGTSLLAIISSPHTANSNTYYTRIMNVSGATFPSGMSLKVTGFWIKA